MNGEFSCDTASASRKEKGMTAKIILRCENEQNVLLLLTFGKLRSQTDA
jgi:hypothetical protein